jgi:hypothetical protein
MVCVARSGGVRSTTTASASVHAHPDWRRRDALVASVLAVDHLANLEFAVALVLLAGACIGEEGEGTLAPASSGSMASSSTCATRCTTPSRLGWEARFGRTLCLHQNGLG